MLGKTSSLVAPQERSDRSTTAESLQDLMHFSAGGIASAVGKSCTAPLSRLTILMQVRGMATHSFPSSFTSPVTNAPSAFNLQSTTNQVSHGGGGLLREASRIASDEGIRAFWKGNGVTILHRLPYASISFYTYEMYRNALQSTSSKPWVDTYFLHRSRSVHYEIEGHERSDSNMGFAHRIVAGGAAAATAVCATYPLDLVRTRLAAQKNDAYYKGILHALFKIPKDEGVMSLYKGMGATLLCVGPNIAINFCIYETLKAEFSRRQRTTSSEQEKQQIMRPSPFSSLACGSVSGFASSTLTFPLDVVRRRRQMEGVGGTAVVEHKREKKSVLGMIVQIARNEGIMRGLYRGLLAEYLKVVPSVGITFTTYEFLKSAFNSSPIR